MTLLIAWLLVLLAIFWLCYMRATGSVWGVGLAVSLGLFVVLQGLSLHASLLLALCCALIWGILNWRPSRLLLLIKPVMHYARRSAPQLSPTERTAIDCGNIGWEASLYHGRIDFATLYSIPPAKLSKQEQDFIKGPVEEFCSMLNSWELQNHPQRIPDNLLQFLKKNKFFGLIIPETHSGLGFSGLAHSNIISKIASINASVASLVSVPNSLGPAELLLKYGTKKQQKHFLPRLACGQEIPCFALTSPTAGSDAGAMVDYGVVCRCTIDEKDCIGIRLNWHKRYITLAPIATLMGLAFKLYDPEHLLGEDTDLGITCALIATDLSGISIGRRHNPLNAIFPNGPIKGKNVLIRLDDIIGGPEMVGQGWLMLMECLAAGRSISLPAVSAGAAKKCTLVTGAYSCIRRQFDRPLAEFGGIQAKLADMVGHTYIIEAVRNFSMSCMAQGQQSLVASGICKFHVTELGRRVVQDAMDVHAGKAICLGPNNYLAELHQTSPIGITVEGANILTRCMMIFGQGLMRCHPYLYQEVKIINKTQISEADRFKFDETVTQHARGLFSNIAFCLWNGLLGGRTLQVQPHKAALRRPCQQLQHYTGIFATLSDILCIIYGGKLKFKEQISANMSDIHSYLYIATTLLHDDKYQTKAEQNDDLLIWGLNYLLDKIHHSISAVIHNLPTLPQRILVKACIFPCGSRYRAVDNHKRNSRLAKLVQEPSNFSAIIRKTCYTAATDNNPAGQVLSAMHDIAATEHLLIKVIIADKRGEITGLSIFDKIQAAKDCQIITAKEADKLHQTEVLRQKIIAVDDFDKLQTRY